MAEDVVFLICITVIIIIGIVCVTALMLTDKLAIQRRQDRFGLPEWKWETSETRTKSESDDR